MVWFISLSLSQVGLLSRLQHHSCTQSHCCTYLRVWCSVRRSISCALLSIHQVGLLSRLQHPNIIGYHDAFLEDGQLCIVMELASYATAGSNPD